MVMSSSRVYCDLLPQGNGAAWVNRQSRERKEIGEGKDRVVREMN